jgi:UDP-glucuronate 4-epimerase
MNSKLFVTGGAGFIGSHLCERLLKDGADIICLDNYDSFYDKKIKIENIQLLKNHSKFVFIEGDIRDRELVKEIFAKNDIGVVFHLAAKAGVRPSIEQPDVYYDVNVNGTLNVLEAMKKSSVKKMIFASSSSVYGNSPNVPFAETDPCITPISPYAATKRASELLCHSYHHLYSMDIFCLRFFTVYGPRQRPDLAIHKFSDLIIHGKPITYYGEGDTKRDYTFIDDIIDGIILATEKVSGFRTINLGESRTVSLKEMVETLEEVIGKKAIIQRLPIQPGDVNITYADLTSAREILGYSPQWSFRDGIEQFIKWKRKQLQP